MKILVIRSFIFLFILMSSYNYVSSETMTSREQALRTVLSEFLSAFENGDTEKMETYFARDAVTFPRAIMSNNYEPGINTDDYRRVTGIDPNMLAAVDNWKATQPGPPYISLQPEDLDIKMYTDVALVTFHLTGENSVSRRSFVLSDTQGEWKIIHLHASNVIGTN
jgi:hypothetical protein